MKVKKIVLNSFPSKNSNPVETSQSDIQIGPLLCFRSLDPYSAQHFAPIWARDDDCLLPAKSVLTIHMCDDILLNPECLTSESDRIALHTQKT